MNRSIRVRPERFVDPRNLRQEVLNEATRHWQDDIRIIPTPCPSCGLAGNAMALRIICSDHSGTRLALAEFDAYSEELRLYWESVETLGQEGAEAMVRALLAEDES
jgi:hypothetical protein